MFKTLNHKNNENKVCAGYNVTTYRRDASKCMKDLKWKVTLNGGRKILFFCDYCKDDGLYSLDNCFDSWDKSELNL